MCGEALPELAPTKRLSRSLELERIPTPVRLDPVLRGWWSSVTVARSLRISKLLKKFRRHRVLCT